MSAKLSDDERLRRRRERNAAWAARNGDKMRAYGRDYARRNATVNSERSRVWRLDNKDRPRVKGKPEDLRAATARFRKTHPERVRSALARYNAAHPEKSQAERARRRGAPGSGLTLDQWLEIVEAFRERCAYCDELTQLEIEHVVPLSKGGRHAPENIVPACGPCNKQKSNKQVDAWFQSKAA